MLDEVCVICITLLSSLFQGKYLLDVRMKERGSGLSLDVMGEKKCLPLPGFCYFIGQTTPAALFWL
jgi:hypothetical protein